jgi:hypothetical protein
MTIDGDVISVYSHWTADGSRIETAATVRTPDGDVIVNQLGGTVDGIGMIQMPGPPILELGMRVAVAAHKGFDLAQQEHVVLDSVKVLDYPPGYVRTGPTKAGTPLYWESGCAFVTVDSAGTTAIPGDQEFAIVDASIDEWNTKTASCSYFTLVNDGRRALEAGNDKVNLIKFHDTSCACMDPNVGPTAWGCRPATMDAAAHCYSRDAAGITTALYINQVGSPRIGAILDADIELNGVDFDISVNGATNGPPGKQHAELQNTLTHELGHLHGLEHPCWIGGEDPHRVDNQGNPVPQCTAGLPAKITESTMYPTQGDGETKKESLTLDDVQMMCDVYPMTSAQTCERVPTTTSAGCCSASGGRDRSDISLLLAGTTVLLLMRRRKNSRDA